MKMWDVIFFCLKSIAIFVSNFVYIILQKVKNWNLIFILKTKSVPSQNLILVICGALVRSVINNKNMVGSIQEEDILQNLNFHEFFFLLLMFQWIYDANFRDNIFSVSNLSDTEFYKSEMDYFNLNLSIFFTDFYNLIFLIFFSVLMNLQRQF